MMKLPSLVVMAVATGFALCFDEHRDLNPRQRFSTFNADHLAPDIGSVKEDR